MNYEKKLKDLKNSKSTNFPTDLSLKFFSTHHIACRQVRQLPDQNVDQNFDVVRVEKRRRFWNAKQVHQHLQYGVDRRLCVLQDKNWILWKV